MRSSSLSLAVAVAVLLSFLGLLRRRRKQEGPLVERNVFGEEPLDEWQPAYHLSSRRNWLNDPNGCEFRKGTYRVSFQHNPSSARWGDISWGVAVSKDLVRWTREKTILTSPRPSYETLGAWSGSALDDDFLVYSCARHSLAALAGKTTDLCLADRSGTRFAENPVLTAPPNTRGDWRDPSGPFRFEGRTYLALGASVDGRGTVLLVERLSKTTFRHVEGGTIFFQAPPDGPRNFECPDVLDFGGNVFGLKLSPPKAKDIIILGTIQPGPVFEPFSEEFEEFFEGGGKKQNRQSLAAPGRAAPFKFNSAPPYRCGKEKPSWQASYGQVTTLDCGLAYAGQSVKESGERSVEELTFVFFAWVRDVSGSPSADVYNGALSLPRVLSLEEQSVLRYRVAPAVSALRRDEVVAVSNKGSRQRHDNASRLALPAAWANRFEVTIDVDLDDDEARSLTLRSADGHAVVEATLEVVLSSSFSKKKHYFPKNQQQQQQRIAHFAETSPTEHKSQRCSMRAPLLTTTTTRVRLFVDGSLLEWDLGDGLAACSSRRYTTSPLTHLELSGSRPRDLLKAYRLGLS